MTRKEELTQEAAAWRECAGWVLVGPSRKREFLCQVLHPSLTFQWSCGMDYPPTHWPLVEMQSRVSEHSSYAWGTLDEDEWEGSNFVRALFCDLMALECEAEAKEVPRRKH